MRKFLEMREFLNIPVDYYEYKTGHKMCDIHRELCGNMLESGIRPRDIMDAIYSALSLLGASWTEEELWKDIRQSCLEKWKEYKREGFLD